MSTVPGVINHVGRVPRVDFLRYVNMRSWGVQFVAVDKRERTESRASGKTSSHYDILRERALMASDTALYRSHCSLPSEFYLLVLLVAIPRLFKK